MPTSRCNDRSFSSLHKAPARPSTSVLAATCRSFTWKRLRQLTSISHDHLGLVESSWIPLKAFEKWPPPFHWLNPLPPDPYNCAHKNPANHRPVSAHRQRLQGGVAQLVALAGVQLHVQHGHAQTFHVEVLRTVNLPALEMAVFMGNWSSKLWNLDVGVWGWKTMGIYKAPISNTAWFQRKSCRKVAKAQSNLSPAETRQQISHQISIGSQLK